MVAAETSSRATWLLCPSQMWPGSNQFQFSAHLNPCMAVSGMAQETKHFSVPAHISFQPLGGAYDLEGLVELMTALLGVA